jgi:hypothetical protein
MLSLTVSSAAIFFLMSVMQFLLVRLPPIRNSDKFDEQFRDKITIIISCHNSSGMIAQTLLRALLHFDDRNIYIADNNRHKRPKDKTMVIAAGIEYEVHLPSCRRVSKVTGQEGNPGYSAHRNCPSRRSLRQIVWAGLTSFNL